MLFRITYYLVCFSLVNMILTGCSTNGRNVAQLEARPLAAPSVPAGTPNPTPEDYVTAVIAEPDDRVRLDQALAMALLRNPELSGFSYAVRAAEARAVQAGLFPNPELELEIEEFDRDGEGFDSAEVGVALGQLFELGRKRVWRRRLAEAEVTLVGWDFQSKRLGVLAETKKRFIEVLAMERRVDLASSMVALSEKTSKAVSERVTAGKEPQLQASKAKAELELTRMQLRQARNDLGVSKRRLAAMWGEERFAFTEVEDDLDKVLELIPPLESLQSHLPKNPDLARWDAELRTRNWVLESEKAARVPDLEASVGLQRFEEDGTDALTFAVGLPLPLFDRNQGNIAAAEHELAKAQSERLSVKKALSTELAEAYAHLTSTHMRLLTLRTNLVPAMKDAFQAAQEGYRQGKFGFLDMLDAQRGLFEAQGALVDALAEYHVAVAEIERTTGTSIEEMEPLNNKESK